MERIFQLATTILWFAEYEYNFKKIRKTLPSDDSSDKFWHSFAHLYIMSDMCTLYTVFVEIVVKYVQDFSKMYEKIKVSNENIGKVKRQSDGKGSLDKND